jgi:hypothetical protein
VTAKQTRQAQRKHYEMRMALMATMWHEAKVAARCEERRLLSLVIGVGPQQREGVEHSRRGLPQRLVS